MISPRAGAPPPPPRETLRIETPRLLLRAARKDDIQDLHKCFTDPQVMQYWSTLPHETLAQTERWVGKMIQDPQNGYTDFIIADRRTDRAIGKIGLWAGSEVGFLLVRERWRRGIVSEAMSAVLPYLFGQMGLESITADVDPRNEGCLALLKGFGFREVGRRENTFQLGEEWVDSVDLALTREDWKRDLRNER